MKKMIVFAGLMLVSVFASCEAQVQREEIKEVIAMGGTMPALEGVTIYATKSDKEITIVGKFENTLTIPKVEGVYKGNHKGAEMTAEWNEDNLTLHIQIGMMRAPMIFVFK